MHIFSWTEKVEEKTSGDKKLQEILRKREDVVYIHLHTKYIVNYIIKHPQRDMKIGLFHRLP